MSFLMPPPLLWLRRDTRSRLSAGHPGIPSDLKIQVLTAFLALREMNNLRIFKDRTGFDRHPGHQFP